MKTILGIDLGISSVGWSLVEEHPNRQDNKIIATGVRIFTKAESPKDGSSLALPRRMARGARRTTNRKAKRMYRLKKLLMEVFSLQKADLFEQKGLTQAGSETIYKEKNKKDVWQLRSEGLERKLSNKEFARILTHIAKRRGYKSNAKSTDSDEDGKKVLNAITKNKEEMQKKACLTVGQYFYQKSLAESKKNSKRAISSRAKIRNAQGDYKQCVDREMLEEEVKILFEKQKDFGFDLKSDFLKKYLKIAAEQKPLKNVEEMIGHCTFEPTEKRAAKQSYSGEIFTALKEIINNAILVDTDNKEISLLEKYNFETIEKVLQETKEIKYSTLRKQLAIKENLQFKKLNYSYNIESETKLNSYQQIIEKETWLNEEQKKKISWLPPKKEKREKQKALNNYSDLKRRLNLSPDFKFPHLKYLDSLKEIIKKVEDKKLIELKGYHTIKKTIDNQVLFEKIFADKDLFNQIGTILATEKDPDITVDKLKEKIHQSPTSFSEQEIQALTDKLKNISFDKYLHLSLRAIDKLLPLMKKGMKYNQACSEIYGHHSQFIIEKKEKFLRKLNKQENYQLTNPVVKRCFAQFRKVLNAIIKKYGPFDSMHIELARELKNSKTKRDQIKKGQDTFKEKTESLKEKFKELSDGREPNSKELAKLRFYEEQNGKCIYSEQAIEIERLINDATYCEIDHILPYSRSFDNSRNNKVVVLASENQKKRNKTPFEWLGREDANSPEWLDFQNRVNSLYISGIKKANLKNTTLTKRHGDKLNEDDTENTESENNFIARNLIDTQFLARFTKNFVEKNLLFKENKMIKQKVKARNGSLISYLRYLWGLENKNRDTHLHHAEDATIIAFSTQSEIQILSTNSARFENYKFASKQEKDEIKQLKSKRPFPQKHFEEMINNIFVSHAPRRKVSGSAHEETLYSGSNKYGKKYRLVKTVEGNKKTIEMEGSTRLYPQKLNRGKSLAKKGGMPRIDIFQHKEKKKYYIVPIYVADFVKPELPRLAIVSGKKKDGTKKPWLEMNEEYQFIASFYKADLIKIHFKKETIFGYFNAADSSSGTINIENMKGITEENYGSKDKKTNLIKRGLGIQNASKIEKYQVDSLGQLNQVRLPEKRVGTKKQLRKLKKNK